MVAKMVTRFAPSPTGYLHLGHAYSARMGFDAARRHGGTFLLRIEDIDQTRCRPEFVDGILEDMHFLGLRFPTPVRKQSDHMADYEAAIQKLLALDVLYPCFCTRAEIAAELQAAQSAPQDGAQPAPIYPGRCRSLVPEEAATRMSQGHNYALRLSTEKTERRLRDLGRWPLDFFDTHHGTVAVSPSLVGDVVLARKEVRTSYHLAVVVDDAIQQVTLVTRGEDLFLSTHVHRQLQALLDLPTPRYAHHPLLRDVAGERLAKRRGSESIRSLRQKGMSADEMWAKIGCEPLPAV